jgi:hypothetical protein
VARDPRIIVDLAALEFIDCCALGALGRVRAQARQAGGDLLLAAPRGPVRRILALTGLSDVFSVHASVADAVRIARPAVTVAQPAPAAGRRRARERYSWPGHWKGRVSWRDAVLTRAPGFRLAGQDGGQPGEQDVEAALEFGGAVVGGE